MTARVTTMSQKRSDLTAAHVAVAIVNYNTRDLLERCIQSILSERPATIVVIDNASPDGSAAFVRRRFPDVQVVANENNVGYGAALNQALEHTTAPLVLVLNADTELEPGCIATLAASCLEAPRAAIIAPAIVNRRGDHEVSAFPFPGTLGWLLENDPLAPIVRLIPPLARRSVSLRPIASPRTVPWVMGCAMLLRRECMQQVRGFDEDFFMYFEEVDLCRRVTDAGWEVFFDPRAVVMHVGGASTGQQRTVMTIQHFESTMRYYHRYFSGARLALWVAALRVKRVAMLARDSAHLLVERDPSERKRLRDRKLAWTSSLEVSRGYGRHGSAVHVGEDRAG